MKREIRVLGIDDAPFSKNDKEVLVVGVIYRAGLWMEGVISTKIKKDGFDATLKLSKMIKNSRFYNELKAIFIGGITIGGFNVIDIEKLSKKTSLPVISFTRYYPDYPKIYKALKVMSKHDPFSEKKRKVIEKTPPPVRIGKLFVQWSGCEEQKVKEFIEKTAIHSYFPEPLRAAHLIGAGIMLGESKGRV